MWIDVNDKLPKDLGNVIVTDGQGSYCVAYFDDDGWNISLSMIFIEYCYEISIHYEITHWKEIEWQNGHTINQTG